MSSVTKIQKRHRAQRRARDLWWERAFATLRRRRPPVLKRPPKWLRHAARRDPAIASLARGGR